MLQKILSDRVAEEGEPIKAFGGLLRFFRGILARPSGLGWLMMLGVYAPLSLWVTHTFREKINEDAVFYIHRAYLLTHGHAWDSVSAYWSPLISWCIAPFFLLRHHGHLLIEPVHATHLMLAAWGGLFVLAVDRLFRTLLNVPMRWRAAALLCVALLAIFIETRTITPDELLGTLLAFYFSFAAQPRFLTRRRTPLMAGLVGGLCYLCKAYGLPFILFHHTCNCAYRAWLARRAAKLEAGGGEAGGGQARLAAGRLAVRAWLLGVAGFGILALPWITTISIKYGRPVFSTNKAFNHLAVGPPEVISKTDFPDCLNIPKDPFLTINEVVDLQHWPDWSPFASWRNFTWQIGVVFQHGVQALGDAWRFDNYGISLGALGLTIVAAGVSLRMGRRSPLPFPAVELWIAGTGAIYLSGFMIVAYENRYVVPVMIPLAIALVLRLWWRVAQYRRGAAGVLASDAGDFAQPAPAVPPPRWLSGPDDAQHRATAGRVVEALVYLSLTGFFWSMLADAWPYLDDPGGFRPIYRQVAQRMLDAGLGQGHFASTETPRGACVAYYLNQKLIPFPWYMDLGDIEKSLADRRVRTIIIWRYPYAPGISREMSALRLVRAHRNHWQRELRIRMRDALIVEVYVWQRHPRPHAPRHAQMIAPPINRR